MKYVNVLFVLLIAHYTYSMENNEEPASNAYELFGHYPDVFGLSLDQKLDLDQNEEPELGQMVLPESEIPLLQNMVEAEKIAATITYIMQLELDRLINECLWNVPLSPEQKDRLIPYIRKCIAEKIYMQSIAETQ